MRKHTNDSRDDGLTIGLLAGAVVGAGLAMWLGPRVVSGVRGQVTRAGGAARKLARKGRDAGDGLADAVARGAHDVERIAKSAKYDARVQPS